MQLAMTDLVPLKRQAKLILAVLADGKPHSAVEFKRGAHIVDGERLFVDAVSQRIGEINHTGLYRVENIKRDGGVAVYQLASSPDYDDGHAVDIAREMAAEDKAWAFEDARTQEEAHYGSCLAG